MKERNDVAALRILEADLNKLSTNRLLNALKLYRPYPKQREFHDAGATHDERLFMAGNQLGKTLSGAMETAYHLTGKYPPDWKGHRFDHAVKWWAAAQTGIQTRDGVQKYLMGEPGVLSAFGTGAIPKADIIDTSLARGVDSLYDTIQVQHYNKDGVKDGISILKLKSFDQGRTKWQSDTIDGVWFDEEPDEEIYSEGITRTVARKGIAFMTFTPLKGMSAVVKGFMNERKQNQSLINMTIEDVDHWSAEEKAAVINKYPAHEREARSKGIPILGSGLIFLTPEVNLRMTAINPLPRHWVYIWGFDFGVNHPFAAVLVGWDRDANAVYVVHCIRMKAVYGQIIRPLDHAEAVKAYLSGHGGEIPIAWPQDGTARENTSEGETVAAIYRKHKLNMLHEHATFSDGGLSTEAGILQMEEYMTTGRFKVFDHNTNWFEEYRLYHREDGKIVKVDDDLLSATRCAIMMLRKARLLPEHDPWKRAGATARVAADVDFSVI